MFAAQIQNNNKITHMKKIKLLVLAIVALVGTSFAQTKSAPWAELKAFHQLMSTTFHPSEEGNLKPLREKSEDLVNAAKKWKEAEIPADYKPKETKETLETLYKQTVAINEKVKANATDTELKTMIAEAHDTFHKVVGECKKVEEHEGHGH